MEPAWTKKNIDMPYGLKALLDTAKVAQYWIYNKVTKKWYTPEELANNWQGIYSEDKAKRLGNEREFTVADPRWGLRKRIDYMQKVAKEVQDFQTRIDEYYDLKKK